MTRMFRYEIPVDDRKHEIVLHGPIRHVATRNPAIVEVWAEHHDDEPAAVRTFTVYGTGHPINPDHVWVGTTLTPVAGLVWHLFEVTPAADR